MKRKPPTISKQRQHVLMKARMAYRRLKRRGLMLDATLYPDQSPKVVAMLAVFAYDCHAYLNRHRSLPPESEKP